MSDVGGDVGVNSINLTLDDEAANSLFDEGQLTTGTYKPTKGTTPFCPPLTPICLGNDPVPNIWPTPAPDLSVSRSQLSGFDGKDPNGTWKLYVIDDTRIEAGTFAGGWSLELDTSTTPPEMAPTVTDTFPTDTNVERTTNVTATFSEDMNAETINTSTFKLFKKCSTTNRSCHLARALSRASLRRRRLRMCARAGVG
jgi:hypothetical protein